MRENSGGYPWRYGLFLMAYYITNSVYQGFITVYFQQNGLSTAQIGALMSAAPFVSLFSQPLWGAVGDRVKSRTALLRALCVGAAAAILAFLISDAFGFLLVMLCLYSAFFTALQPMGDSVILESLQQRRQGFGPIRLLASLAFAFSSMSVGALVDGRINWVIYLTALMLGLVFLSTFALPNVAGHQRVGHSGNMLMLLRHRELGHLLAFITLLQVTMGYFYSFFSVHFIALPGGNAQLLGWAYFISSVSEMPFLLCADRLFDRLGAGKLLCVSALALTLRWVLLGFLTDVYWVMATQVLHGWGFIVMTVSMSKYISITVPEELRARGQMLLAVVGYGVARVVGCYGGGLIAQSMGMGPAFFVSAAISAAALALYAPRYLRCPALNGVSR